MNDKIQSRQKTLFLSISDLICANAGGKSFGSMPVLAENEGIQIKKTQE